MSEELKQAAQTEREAFERWWEGSGFEKFKDTAFAAWEARALTAAQQATPAEAEHRLNVAYEAVGMVIENDTLSINETRLFDWLGGEDLTDPIGSMVVHAVDVQQATLEPVPRSVFIVCNDTAMCAFAARDLADRFVSSFGGSVAGGMTVVEVPVVGATPEPVGEAVAYREKLTGRLCEPEDTHRRKFPMCYEPLYTRPAPGVPEGWRNVIAGTLKTDPWDSARVADYNSGWNDCQRKTLRGLERLAAAQAKGDAP